MQSNFQNKRIVSDCIQNINTILIISLFQYDVLIDREIAETTKITFPNYQKYLYSLFVTNVG